MRETHNELHPTIRKELKGLFCKEHCATLCIVNIYTVLNMHLWKKQTNTSLRNPDNNQPVEITIAYSVTLIVGTIQKDISNRKAEIAKAIKTMF